MINKTQICEGLSKTICNCEGETNLVGWAIDGLAVCFSLAEVGDDSIFPPLRMADDFITE